MLSPIGQTSDRYATRNIFSYFHVPRNMSPLCWIRISFDHTDSGWYERLESPCFRTNPRQSYFTVQKKDDFFKLIAGFFYNGLGLQCTIGRLKLHLVVSYEGWWVFWGAHSWFRCNKSYIVLSISKLPSCLRAGTKCILGSIWKDAKLVHLVVLVIFRSFRHLVLSFLQTGLSIFL